MVRSVEMFGCMLILGRVATSHMPAAETKPQMDPFIAHFYAFFADMYVGFADFDLIEMGASVCHDRSPEKCNFSVK